MRAPSGSGGSSLVGLGHQADRDGLVGPVHEAIDPEQKEDDVLLVVEPDAHAPFAERLDAPHGRRGNAELQEVMTGEVAILERVVRPAPPLWGERLTYNKTPRGYFTVHHAPGNECPSRRSRPACSLVRCKAPGFGFQSSVPFFLAAGVPVQWPSFGCGARGNVRSVLGSLWRQVKFFIFKPPRCCRKPPASVNREAPPSTYSTTTLGPEPAPTQPLSRLRRSEAATERDPTTRPSFSDRNSTRNEARDRGMGAPWAGSPAARACSRRRAGRRSCGRTSGYCEGSVLRSRCRTAPGWM